MKFRTYTAYVCLVIAVVVTIVHLVLLSTTNKLTNNPDGGSSRWSWYKWFEIFASSQRNKENEMISPDSIIDDEYDSLSINQFNLDHTINSTLFDKFDKENQKFLDTLKHRPTFRCDIRQLNHIHQYIEDTIIAKDHKVVQELPDFSYDFTEYIIGSIIERVSDSWNLYLNIYMMSHDFFERMSTTELDTNPIVDIREDMIPYWRRLYHHFNQTKTHYYNSGERKQPPNINVRLTHHMTEKSYTVICRFLPTALSVDLISNKGFDILRCPMKHTKKAYTTLANTNATMKIEILKHKHIISMFYISWLTRRVGFMLHDHSNPIEPSTTSRPFFQPRTKFDPWKGFNINQPGKWTHDKFYLVVPELEFKPSPRMIGQVVEFVQHHINIGTQHIFLSIPYSRESQSIYLLCDILATYINDGLVTLTTSSNDGYDNIRGYAGAQLERDYTKFIYLNAITCLSKGVSNYIGVWDLDEFLIPQGMHRTVHSMIDAIESPVILRPPILPSYTYTFMKNNSSSSKVRRYDNTSDSNSDSSVYTDSTTDSTYTKNMKWSGGRGWADEEMHPSCGLVLQSRVLYNHPIISKQSELIWIGDRFPHFVYVFGATGLEHHKSIRDTRKVYYGGLHLVTTCALPYEWTPCYLHTNMTYHSEKPMNISTYDYHDGELCYESDSKYMSKNHIHDKYKTSEGLPVHRYHRIDESIGMQDYTLINYNDTGVIYHIQLFRESFVISDEELSMYWSNPALSSHTHTQYTDTDTSSESVTSSSTSTDESLKDRTRNDYISLYYDNVMHELNQRQLKVRFLLPETLYHTIYMIEKTYIRGKWKDHDINTYIHDPENDQSASISILPVLSKIDYFIYLATSISISISISINPLLSRSNQEKAHINVNEEGINTNIQAYVLIYRIHENYEAYTMKWNFWTSTNKFQRNNMYICNIRNTDDSESYQVKGIVEQGKLIDIIRCPIKLTSTESITIYQNQSQQLTVTLYQSLSIKGDEAGQYDDISQYKSVLRISMPWHQSVLSALWNVVLIPAVRESTVPVGRQSAQSTDVLRDNSDEHMIKSNQSPNSLRIASLVPGIAYYPTQQTISYYLEYIQHMLNIGISHIYLCVYFSQDSIHMKRLVEILTPYLNQDVVTIISIHYENTIFMVPSIRKMLFSTLHNDEQGNVLEILMINLGLIYSSIHHIDYLIITQLNDLFLPSIHHTSNISSIINDIISYQSQYDMNNLSLSCILNIPYYSREIPIYIEQSNHWIYEKLMYDDIIHSKQSKPSPRQKPTSNIKKLTYLLPILQVHQRYRMNENMLYERYPVNINDCPTTTSTTSTSSPSSTDTTLSHSLDVSSSSSSSFINMNNISSFTIKNTARIIRVTTPPSSQYTYKFFRDRTTLQHYYPLLFNTDINSTTTTTATSTTMQYNAYTNYYALAIYSQLQVYGLVSILQSLTIKEFECNRPKQEKWINFIDLYYYSGLFKSKIKK